MELTRNHGNPSPSAEQLNKCYRVFSRRGPAWPKVWGGRRTFYTPFWASGMSPTGSGLTMGVVGRNSGKSTLLQLLAAPSPPPAAR